MNYLAYLIILVFGILAAILGWHFGPNHCFTCLSIAVAAIGVAGLAPVVMQKVPNA